MKKQARTQKLILEEITEAASKLNLSLRGLSIGQIIAMIRTQLGMSQTTLAKRAAVPQSTISRVEKSKQTPNLSTLNKILGALSCKLILAPLLLQKIDTIKRKQARHIAQNNIRYLQGTMSLEKQEPDAQLIESL